MPRGVYMRGMSPLNERERLRMEGLDYTHRLELAAKGYDPDMIGCTEVEPPCCPGCGRSIPWTIIRLYR